MRGVKFILFLLFLLGVRELFAQNRADLDSLRHHFYSAKTDTTRVLILSDWSRTIFNANPDSSLILARKGLQLSQKINFTKGIGRTKRNIAYCNIMNGKGDSALLLLAESIDNAKKINDLLCIGLINVNYANYYGQKGEYKRAIGYLYNSIRYFTIIKNRVEIGKVYNNLAIMYKEIGAFPKAFSYYNLSATICKETHDYNSLSIIYNNLGLMAFTQGDFNKALTYYFSALKIFEKNDNKRILSITYNNIGDTYRYLNQTNKALEYLLKSLKVSKEIGQKSSIGLAYENIGLIYFESHPPQLNKALSYFFKSYKFYQDVNDINSLTGISSIMIEIYIALKNYPKALEMLKMGLELSQKVESAETQAELHRAASEYYFATKEYSRSLEQSRLGIQFARKAKSLPIFISNLNQNSIVAGHLNLLKEAYHSILEYSKLKDSIQTQAEKKNLFLKEFQYKEANMKLEQFQKEMTFKRAETRRQWILFSGAIVFIFLMFHAFSISKNLKKQTKFNKVLNEINNTKDKLFSIISHDLRNPFNSILGFSELLMNNTEEFDKQKVKEISTSLYQTSKSTYDLLEQLLDWSALQSNKIVYTPEKVDLKTLIVENIKMVNSLVTQKEMQIIDNTINDQFVLVDQNMLNTVIRNLITNAIKFTHNGGKIEISSTISSHFLYLSIKDNGQGISPQKIKDLFNFGKLDTTKGTNNETGTGLGLILCKEFVERNKGELFIKSEEGKSSDFIISLPLFV
jgi:signal transduction histidine kinase